MNSYELIIIEINILLKEISNSKIDVKLDYFLEIIIGLLSGGRTRVQTKNVCLSLKRPETKKRPQLKLKQYMD